MAPGPLPGAAAHPLAPISPDSGSASPAEEEEEEEDVACLEGSGAPAEGPGAQVEEPEVQAEEPGVQAEEPGVQAEESGVQAEEPGAPAGEDEQEILCDFCLGDRRVRAVKSCLTCMVNYCEEHLRPHQENSRLHSHQLTEPVRDHQDLHACPTHRSPLVAFCCSDGQCICQECCQDQHRDHNTVTLDIARRDKEASVWDLPTGKGRGWRWKRWESPVRVQPGCGSCRFRALAGFSAWLFVQSRHVLRQFGSCSKWVIQSHLCPAVPRPSPSACQFPTVLRKCTYLFFFFFNKIHALAEIPEEREKIFPKFPCLLDPIPKANKRCLSGDKWSEIQELSHQAQGGQESVRFSFWASCQALFNLRERKFPGCGERRGGCGSQPCSALQLSRLQRFLGIDAATLQDWLCPPLLSRQYFCLLTLVPHPLYSSTFRTASCWPYTHIHPGPLEARA